MLKRKNMNVILIDLIFNNSTKFPQPDKADIPISGIRYQVIGKSNQEIKLITFIHSNIIPNASDSVEFVDDEYHLIKRVFNIISGDICEGSFIIDWTGFDYQYLIGRMLRLALPFPYTTGHLAIASVYKRKYPNQSLRLQDIYEKTNGIAPMGEFSIFKFNTMKILYNMYVNFIQ